MDLVAIEEKGRILTVSYVNLDATKTPILQRFYMLKPLVLKAEMENLKFVS